MLEASTGRERHTVLDLARASVADLDGDGLEDLWGEANGELRAFRGEAPEVWRALGSFHAADDAGARGQKFAARSVDFDGDGIADTLIDGMRAGQSRSRAERKPHGGCTFRPGRARDLENGRRSSGKLVRSEWWRLV